MHVRELINMVLILVSKPAVHESGLGLRRRLLGGTGLASGAVGGGGSWPVLYLRVTICDCQWRCNESHNW